MHNVNKFGKKDVQILSKYMANKQTNATTHPFGIQRSYQHQKNEIARVERYSHIRNKITEGSPLIYRIVLHSKEVLTSFCTLYFKQFL